MKKVYIKALLEKEYIYLNSVYPIKWTNYVSSAKLFTSEEEAIYSLNVKYYELSTTYEDWFIKSIMIDTYEGTTLISSRPYMS